ncbi:hypothetical protein AB7008_29595 [Bradyrhizobium sp. 521_C7_N1_3]|uniref:hypothetical protein n=1 Tax=Bradyrhizobium sp. 521_C7_N1_3 TaxID=3240368 RepID=UPI003F8871DB
MRQLLGGAGDGKIDDGEQGHGGATLECSAIFDAVDILYKSPQRSHCERSEAIQNPSAVKSRIASLRSQ